MNSWIIDDFMQGNNNSHAVEDEVQVLISELNKRFVTLASVIETSDPKEHKEASDALSSSIDNLTTCITNHKQSSTNNRQNYPSVPSEIIQSTPTEEELSAESPDVNRRRRRTTTSSRARTDSLTPQEACGIIPKEILTMMDSESSESVFSAAIALEYGGLDLPPKFTRDGGTKRRSLKQYAKSLVNASIFVDGAKQLSNVGKDDLEYVPSEFSRLGIDERTKLAKLLSWDNLKVWGFDTFEIERLSTIQVFKDIKEPLQTVESSRTLFESSEHGCPIILIGWALLASPYSQFFMAKDVNDQELMEVARNAIRMRANTVKGESARSLNLTGESNSPSSINSSSSIHRKDAWNGGYFLPDEFAVSPKAICRLLRKVENEYPKRLVNPYHNNIHAADVIQSTHALIQMGGEQMEMAYTPLELYSILWAAALHDIKHPGTNNNYQINKRTELAKIYNDISVLENMHASRACFLLEGMDESGDYSEIFGSMTDEQRKLFRTSLIRSILFTDMSKHFSWVAEMTKSIEAMEEEAATDSDNSPRPVLARIGSKDHEKFRTNFLPYILHMADIGNSAKVHHVQLEWSDCVYDEFFLQGDREAAENMPISPLCDRSTTKIAEAQVGFMNFVVRPSFVLLWRCLPNVADIILSQLDTNLKYWNEEKAKDLSQDIEEKAEAIKKEGSCT